MGHLATGVDSCISTSGDREAPVTRLPGRCPQHQAEGVLHGSLNGTQARLHSPAGKVCATVGEIEPNS